MIDFLNNIINMLVIPYIVGMGIAFTLFIIKSIKSGFLKIIMIICQIVLIVSVVLYLANNEVLDLGQLIIFLVVQVVLFALYILNKTWNKDKEFYDTLQRKPYINLWISVFADMDNTKRDAMIKFINDVREKVEIYNYMNICFFYCDEKTGKAEYSIIAFGKYNVTEAILEDIEIVEANKYKKGIAYKFKKQIIEI